MFLLALGVWALARGGHRDAAAPTSSRAAAAASTASASAPAPPESAAPAPPESAAPAPPESAAPAPPESATPAPPESATPAPTGSASPVAAATGDASVKFACTPTCEWLECDGKKIETDADTTFAPGAHTCHAGAHGFLAKTEQLRVEAGEHTTHEIHLERLPPGPLEASRQAEAEAQVRHLHQSVQVTARHAVPRRTGNPRPFLLRRVPLEIRGRSAAALHAGA